MLAASVLAGIDTVAGQSYQKGSGIALTLIGLGTAAALAWVALGLYRARRWSRTPAALTQLFVGIVGIYLVQGHRYAWGIPSLVLACAGFALLLTPASLRALAGPRPGTARAPGRHRRARRDPHPASDQARPRCPPRPGTRRPGSLLPRTGRPETRQPGTRRPGSLCPAGRPAGSGNPAPSCRQGPGGQGPAAKPRPSGKRPARG